MQCFERDALIVGKLFDDIRANGIDTFALSRSQLQQDIFALSQSGSKQSGFFVEIGATDGVSLSNTYLLETKFNWHGIVVEPSACWHEALRRNRRCVIDTSCIWAHSNQTLPFRQFSNKPEYSGLKVCNVSDLVEAMVEGENAFLVEMETLSLLHLLERHSAPRIIDYLSIDTEGSEFEILAAFDFSRYDVRTITVEHNFTDRREDIYQLLTREGYQRCLTTISKWDDWYTRSSL